MSEAAVKLVQLTVVTTVPSFTSCKLSVYKHTIKLRLYPVPFILVGLHMPWPSADTLS